MEVDEVERAFLADDDDDVSAAHLGEAHVEVGIHDLEEAFLADADEPVENAIPDGITWKSVGYCKFMRDMKKVADPVLEKYSALKDCWNRIPRRYGDEAVELGDDGRAVANSSWVHGNTYSMKGTVKAAVGEIGVGTKASHVWLPG